MSITKVVNIRKDHYTKYIGRPKGDADIMHWGNPFSHKKGTKAKLIFPTREECIEAFRKWINKEDYHDVEPERRQWILENYQQLWKQTLGCFCADLDCHGCVYLDMLEKRFGGERIDKFTLKNNTYKGYYSK